MIYGFLEPTHLPYTHPTRVVFGWPCHSGKALPRITLPRHVRAAVGKSCLHNPSAGNRDSSPTRLYSDHAQNSWACARWFQLSLLGTSWLLLRMRIVYLQLSIVHHQTTGYLVKFYIWPLHDPSRQVPVLYMFERSLYHDNRMAYRACLLAMGTDSRQYLLL